MQTRKGSIAEAAANTAVGWTINFTANIIFLPILYDPSRPVHSAFVIGLVFTVISLARSYVLRRWFNGLRFGRVVRNPDAPAYNSAGGMEHAP